LTMDVAVMFSGGKDSVFAVHHCLKKGWKVAKLIGVKPKNTEAFLYHYATVEWAKLSSDALGVPFTLLRTDAEGPEAEAEVLDTEFHSLQKAGVTAIVLGGVGLQKTQISSIETIAKRYGMKVMVPHARYTSLQLLEEEVKAGMDIVITDVASDGLDIKWLGKRISAENFSSFVALAMRYGFDVLGEGGYYNTFVVDAPFFQKRVEFKRTETVWDAQTESGFLDVKDAALVAK